MPLDLEDLRLAIYTSLASIGRAPEKDALVASLGVHADVIGRLLRRLAAARHLVLDSSGRLVLAHPFSTIDLGFSVKGRHTPWWGGCTWDSSWSRPPTSWDDVVSCSNQRVFCDEGCLGAWLAREGRERGCVADLATVWRLASGWYAGRLDRGYTRREAVRWPTRTCAGPGSPGRSGGSEDGERTGPAWPPGAS